MTRRIAASIFAAGVILGALPSMASDIRPLPPQDTWIGMRPVPSERGPLWNVFGKEEAFAWHDAADGIPVRCTLILRATTNATDPAFESLEVGIERDPARSVKERIVGTMFLRVRFADVTTWRATTPHAIKVWLDKTTATDGWRIDPPDSDGFVRISKPTLDSDEHERTIFGWAAGDTEVDIAIMPKPGDGWRLYGVTINRVGFPTPAADAMRTCLQAMGSEALTEGAYEAEIRDHRPPK